MINTLIVYYEEPEHGSKHRKMGEITKHSLNENRLFFITRKTSFKPNRLRTIVMPLFSF